MKQQPELLAGEPQNDESRKAILACNDYLRLGPGRSLQKLLDRYQTAIETPLTKRLKTLADWSRSFDWQTRAVFYDAAIEAEKNETVKVRRREVMESGLALDFERVIELKRLAEFLKDQLYEQDEEGKFHNVWLPDVKQAGRGEDAEIVDIERFNPPIFTVLRGLYDDIAKETGGRKATTTVETPDLNLKSLPDTIRELAAKVYGQVQKQIGESAD